MARVWDAFLTDRDKAHLRASSFWGPQPARGLGERPALIVIDDYYAALGVPREPLLDSIKTWPLSCGLEGWAAIDKTVPLIAAARASATPVIYFRGVDDFPSPFGQHLLEESLSPLTEEQRAMANTIVDEIAPQPGDLVIEKTGPSAFWGTPLQIHLTAQGIDTLIIVGESTSGCVRANVVDATTLRYRVAVVEECCFDRTEASHAMNLFDMQQKYADVVDLDAAITYLMRGSAESTMPLDRSSAPSSV